MITADEAADQLIGTCKNLHEIVKDNEDNDVTFCKELDDLCFRCECCDWWFEAGESNDDNLCEDCAESEE